MRTGASLLDGVGGCDIGIVNGGLHAVCVGIAVLVLAPGNFGNIEHNVLHDDIAVDADFAVVDFAFRHAGRALVGLVGVFDVGDGFRVTGEAQLGVGVDDGLLDGDVSADIGVSLPVVGVRVVGVALSGLLGGATAGDEDGRHNGDEDVDVLFHNTSGFRVKHYRFLGVQYCMSKKRAILQKI